MMPTFPKVGLDALLTPENCAVLLIDHQPSQLANVNSHEPTMVINNVTALAKTAKAYGIPTILTTINYAAGGAGIMSAAGLALMGARRSATKIDRRRSQMESPIEVVRRFCAAWSDNIGAAELAAFFTDDAVYHNIPLAPITGRKAIATTIASFIRPGAPGIESLHLRLINIAANGPVVMTERVDAFKLPGKSFELPVMGTFEVREAKISAWR